MKPSRLLISLVLLVGCVGVARAQNGCARLSWGSCDPQVADKAYSSPGTYTLIESMLGVTAANTGTDTKIRLFHLDFGNHVSVPDSWRFDDAGCQTGARLAVSTNGLSKTCPAMTGTNLSTTTSFVIDTDGTAVLHLVTAYDAFTPTAVKYTIWMITFDLSHSNVGPSPPDLSTCGEAELCVDFVLDKVTIHGTNGQDISLQPCDSNVFALCAQATWNGGCAPIHSECNGGLPTETETWGRVKSLYR